MGPDLEASVGYTYVNLEIPSTGRVHLNGVDTTLTANFTPRLALRGDFSYAWAPQTLSYNQSSTVMSSLAGPVIYLARKKNTIFYVDILFGGARVDTTASSQTGALSGYVARFAYAAGSGAQFRFSPRISFRLEGDYLSTQFAQSNVSLQGQNNFRTVASLVYHFSSR